MTFRGATTRPFSTHNVAKRVMPVMRAVGRSENPRYQRFFTYTPVSRLWRTSASSRVPGPSSAEVSSSSGPAPFGAMPYSTPVRALIIAPACRPASMRLTKGGFRKPTAS